MDAVLRAIPRHKIAVGRRLRCALAVAASVAILAPVGGDELRGALSLPQGEQASDWSLAAARWIPPRWPHPATRGDEVWRRLRPDGEFVVAGLNSGWWYLAPYRKGWLDADAVKAVKLPRQPGDAERLALKSSGVRSRLRVVCRDEKDAPVPGARIHLYNLYGIAAGGASETDDEGAALFIGPPAGRYQVWVEPPTDALAAAVFDKVDVTPGASIQTLPLKLPAAGGVRARLLLADGKTPAVGRIVAVQSGEQPSQPSRIDDPALRASGALRCYAQTVTDARGEFVLRGLFPGRLALDVRAPGRSRPQWTLTDVEVIAGQTRDLGDRALAPQEWTYLFDGRTLDGWQESDFYAPAPVRIENHRILIPTGNEMTGITLTRPIPRIDYEVTLQAMRVAGGDFFCGLTFPVKEDPCTLIMGGWGGGVTGLSSLDGNDASENETSQWIDYQDRRWYRVRLRVTADNISVWLDEEPIINADITNRNISIRLEVEASRPFGIATWMTTGAVRDLRIRRLQ